MFKNKKRKIPVFYHIPKNAGTYVSDYMLAAFRHYRVMYTAPPKTQNPKSDTIKFLDVTSGGFPLGRFLIFDPFYFCDAVPSFYNQYSSEYLSTDINNFPKGLFKNVFLFAMIVHAPGFRVFRKLLRLAAGYSFHNFMILRDSFSRAQSFYNYIISENSTHEDTHGLINSKTLEEYILSEKMEDSWLIRNILNMDDCSGPLSSSDCNKCCKALKFFDIYDIKNTHEAIKSAFSDCYHFDIGDIGAELIKNVAKNDTLYKKIDFEELSGECSEAFCTRTFWDRELYGRLLDKNKY